ncbi:MAG: hypothetical protein P1U30_00930 [Phycisphaerales bacterium]|nr:hypothetical protein [Phycisphaerales bacterium]
MNRVQSESRRGSVLAVLVVVLALMGLIVAGSVRPMRDESSLAAMRVETVRAFYAAESGTVITIQGYMGATEMPVEGSEVVIENQVIEFTQIPELGGTAVIHGMSGDAIRRIELALE